MQNGHTMDEKKRYATNALWVFGVLNLEKETDTEITQYTFLTGILDFGLVTNIQKTVLRKGTGIQRKLYKIQKSIWNMDEIFHLLECGYQIK